MCVHACSLLHLCMLQVFGVDEHEAVCVSRLGGVDQRERLPSQRSGTMDRGKPRRMETEVQKRKSLNSNQKVFWCLARQLKVRHSKFNHPKHVTASLFKRCYFFLFCLSCCLGPGSTGGVGSRRTSLGLAVGDSGCKSHQDRP